MAYMRKMILFFGVVTFGSGLIKVVLDKSHEIPEIKRFRRFRCFAEQKELVEYSSLWVQGDSILWLGKSWTRVSSV